MKTIAAASGEPGRAPQAADRPGEGQGGERAPGARRYREQADAEPGRDQHRRMPRRQAETDSTAQLRNSILASS